MQKKQDKQKLFFFLIGIIVVLIAVVAVILYINKKRSDQIIVNPNIEIESLANKTDEDSDNKNIKQEANSALIICQPDVSINKKTGEISFYYKNPSFSRASVVLELSLDDMIIAESGAILPGYELTRMNVIPNIVLSNGNYGGILKVKIFDGKTGKDVGVDTNIEVNVNIN